MKHTLVLESPAKRHGPTFRKTVSFRFSLTGRRFRKPVRQPPKLRLQLNWQIQGNMSFHVQF